MIHKTVGYNFEHVRTIKLSTYNTFVNRVTSTLWGFLTFWNSHSIEGGKYYLLNLIQWAEPGFEEMDEVTWKKSLKEENFLEKVDLHRYIFFVEVEKTKTKFCSLFHVSIFIKKSKAYMFLPMFFKAKYLQEPSTKKRENGHRYLSLTKKPFSVDPFAKKKNVLS